MSQVSHNKSHQKRKQEDWPSKHDKMAERISSRIPIAIEFTAIMKNVSL